MLAALKEAYGEILPDVDFQLLISCHGQLVKPLLAPGQKGLNGSMYKTFQTGQQTSLYLTCQAVLVRLVQCGK